MNSLAQEAHKINFVRRTILTGTVGTVISAASGRAFASPTETEAAFTVLGKDLFFPEGPVAMDDGSVILVEIGRKTLSKVAADGALSVVANLGGGPNGAAIGPDGACYVVNDGGLLFKKQDGRWRYEGVPPDFVGGSVQRVDLKTGAFTTLYTKVGPNSLRGPNDIVFDEWGGFLFTDTGKAFARSRDLGGLYWARPDGSQIREVAFPLNTPNGICLSPDRRTLYVALSDVRQIIAYELVGPGQVAMQDGRPKMRIVASLGGALSFDSMCMEAGGNLVVATVGKGCLTVITPSGDVLEQVKFPEIAVTNVAFGGHDMRTAFVTLSQTGRLAAVRWPRPGLKLLYR